MQISQDQPAVLIVEDDPHIVNLITIILKKSGIDIFDACDGQQALEQVSQKTPNLIISDIMMPNMDGYALRRELLGREDTKLIPFVFLSAKGKSQDIVHGLELDADDYIAKPFDPDVFLAKIKAILRRYAQFNKLLQFDPLTNVYNRRTLETSLKAELHRVIRYKQQVSILLLDLDRFKRVNDEFGHAFGDTVLKKAASLFKHSLRDIDFVGRIGGEEFVIVMPSTDKKTALFVADRLREKMAQIAFNDNGLRVTLSGGVSAAPEDAEEMDDLIKKADLALYTAKNNGRNKIAPAI